MERDSLHEIHLSSSSLPDEPDFFPQADQGWLLILKKAMNSLLGQVHYAKFVPGAILLTTILLLHG